MGAVRLSALLCGALTVVCAVPAFAQDSDADGVNDGQDAFPCDSSAVGEAFAPAQGVHGLVAFEDQWPAIGDEDFNDAVVTYNYAVKTDAQGFVSQARITLNVLAIGGVNDNGLGLALPVAPGALASATRTIGAGSPQPMTPASADTNLNLIVSNNLRELYGDAADQINSLTTQPRQSASPIVIDLTFSAPVDLPLGPAPYDLYIFRSNDGTHQIHRPEYAGTATMNTGLFGTQDDGSSASRYFVDVRGLPFALVMPEDVAYPAEATPISSLYPDILAFAASGGSSAKDYYASTVVSAHAYKDNAGQPAFSGTFVGNDHFSADTSCVGTVYSGDCSNFATLGFSSRDACLRDGLWHDLGQFDAQTPVSSGDNATIDALVKSGADFKVHWPSPSRAIIPVERIIPDCDASNRSCMYARREYGTGKATLGFYSSPLNDNGYFWVGSARDPFTLDTYFAGTAGNLATGHMSYQLKVRPGNWRRLGTFQAGVPVPQAAFDEIRALAERGADFKIQAASGTRYGLIHKVVRIIPRSTCGAECMWFYALRESSDGGYRNLGIAVSRGTSGGVGAVNGDYWVGTPVALSNADNFFGPTNTTHETGRFDYTIYVNDDLSPGAPSYSDSCADALSRGWASEDACLRDGRWHKIGSFTGGQAIDATSLARIDALIATGASFKIRHRGSNNGALIEVERVVPNPGGGAGHWFYLRRENGTGLAVMGMSVMPNTSNGNYWIGTPTTVSNLQGFFTGTSGNIGSGYYDFDIYAKAGAWRQLIASGSQVALSQSQIDEIRTLAMRGANFRLEPTTITYKANHRIVRVIPNVTNGDMWMYARREHPNGGEYTLGMALSTTSRNGNYWIGTPVNITGLDTFFTGTNGTVASGYYGYRLYVEE